MMSNSFVALATMPHHEFSLSLSSARYSIRRRVEDLPEEIRVHQRISLSMEELDDTAEGPPRPVSQIFFEYWV